MLRSGPPERECGLEPLNAITPYVRWVKIDKNVSLAGHWIDYDNVFTFIASGSAAFILDGESYEVREGDVIVMPPLTKHIIASDKSGMFSEYIFHFDLFRQDSPAADGIRRARIMQPKERAVPESETLLTRYPMVIRPPEDVSGEIRRLYLMMHREYTEDGPCSPGLTEAYAKSILLLTYRCTIYKDGEIPEDSVCLWNSIQRIVEIIHTKYNNPKLSIQEIASIAGFSPNYISTLVKRNIGVTIHEYLTFVRIQAAKNMLYESNMNITQIAELVGYSSVYSFSRSFKQATGQSPSQYAHHHLASLQSS